MTKCNLRPEFPQCVSDGPGFRCAASGLRILIFPGMSNFWSRHHEGHEEHRGKTSFFEPNLRVLRAFVVKICISFCESLLLGCAFHFDLYDAPAFHVDDREFVAVVFDPLAGARDAFQFGKHEPRQRVIVRRFIERQTEVGL